MVVALEPAAALATGPALLAGAWVGQDGLAAVVFASPTLVIGSAQPEETVDRDACRRDGVVVLRRGSGGGAVLCDRDLLEVDVAVPAGQARSGPDVTESYRWLGEAWIEALASLGLAASFVSVADARAQSPARRAAARIACYAGLSPYEVVAQDGRKLVGLCQRRRAGAVLYQCSVAVAGLPARVATYVSPVAELLEALAATTSLRDLGLTATTEDVAAAFAAAL